MSSFHGLKICASAASADISLGISSNNSIIELKALLAGKVRYKKLGSIVEKSKIKRSEVGINLAFEKKISMITQLGT